MGSGHGHGHGAPASASGRYAGRLAIGLAILVVFLLLEVVVGLVTSSLALLSDAAHMFTDVLGLAMALAAISAARRPSRSAGRSFGLYRAEVLAALANAVLLFGVAAWVVIEAVQRLSEPPEVPGLPLLLTAAAGLLANLAVFALLRQGAKESLNVRGAYLEVLADTLGSVGVLLAGAVTLLFGWRYADPVVAVAIGVFILPRTWRLARQAVRILVQAAPEHIDLDQVQASLAAVPGVGQAHDVHVWTLTSGMDVGSAHLAVTADADIATVLAAAQHLLSERFGLRHATLQVEPPGADAACIQSTW